MTYKSWLITVSGIYESGYVESANYAESHSVSLLWAGSSHLQDVARAEAVKREINLTIHPVRYSRADLQDATDKIWASKKSEQWQGLILHSIVGTDLTHDGLIVEGHYSDLDSGRAEARLSQASRFAKSIADEVVDVRITEAPVKTTTRSTDTGPFNAGGQMSGPNSSLCTSGFGVRINGTVRTTTARHCTDTPYHAADLSSSSYGSPYQVVSGVGVTVLTGGGFHWMFDGFWWDPTGYHKTVVGYADLAINDFVCTSGANSGVHCNIKVDNLLVSWNDGYGPFWNITGLRQDDLPAAARGDSGGPVLVPYGNDTTVGAAGMMQYANTNTNCGSGLRSPTDCYRRVGFSSTRSLVNDLGPGAILLTG
jgi:hypothetical protein